MSFSSEDWVAATGDEETTGEVAGRYSPSTETKDRPNLRRLSEAGAVKLEPEEGMQPSNDRGLGAEVSDCGPELREGSTREKGWNG